MRIAFLCKRRYMSKDVILDRYARLYEIPYQLARLGHEVRAWCLDYHAPSAGTWQHTAAPGSLIWHSAALGTLKLPAMLHYPLRLQHQLRSFAPHLVIGASDIPHVVLAATLARRGRIPYVIDLYDNFEGFGQAKLPGFVAALRWAVRHAALVTTTSAPLQRLVREAYRAHGRVIAMPSSVDTAVFCPGDKAAARHALALPADALLVGTAGGLYREKGIAPLYHAWEQIQSAHKDVHLVLAGPTAAELPPPCGARVHILGNVAHATVAELFRALDVGIISILDTPFGRYCFPQKAYEMLACHLPVVASEVGAMADLFAATPSVLFPAADAEALANAVLRQLENPVMPQVQITDWAGLVAELEAALRALGIAPAQVCSQ